MNKEDWDEMHKHSIFMNLQYLRSQGLAQENKDGLIGIDRINKTGFVKNTDGFVEVCNAKDELLGIIYKYNKWNKLVWEQDIGVIMTASCLNDILEYINNQQE